MLLLAVAGLSALVPTSASARFTFDDAEREIVAWFSSRQDPALVYAMDLRLLVATEEHVRRRFLLGRCDQHSKYRGPDRLSDEHYRRYVAEIASGLRSGLLEPMQLDGRLISKPLGALIFSYRKAAPKMQADWRRYLRTDAALEGRRWYERLRFVETFHDQFAIDVNTGAVHGAWLHWLSEYLRLAGLRDSFLAAAGTVDVGLGAAVNSFVAVAPEHPLPKARRAELDRISEALRAEMETIASRVFLALDPKAREAVDRWTRQPMVVAIVEARARIDEASATPLLTGPLPGEDEVVTFMRAAWGDRREQMETSDAIINFVKQRVEPACEPRK